MYVVYTIILLLLIAILIMTITLSSREEPIFDAERSENFANIEHYEGKYNNETIKVSPEFEWIEFKGEKYIKKDKQFIGKKDLLNLKDHPFYYIEKPILVDNINKEHNIPKIIWQTMKEEPVKDTLVYEAIQTFKNQKEWEHRFMTDDKAKVFLKENFDEEVLHAFEVLIPGAYKADLLRACLLYIHGGVYADCKLFLHYDLDSFLDRDLVLAREFDNINNKGIWNGFMASIPKNEYFSKVIDNIVKNVKNLDYTSDPIEITGPLLYGKIFMKHYDIDEIKLEIVDSYMILNTLRLKNDSKKIINEYKNQEMFISWDANRSYVKEWFTKDYGILWNSRKVYDLELYKKYF